MRSMIFIIMFKIYTSLQVYSRNIEPRSEGGSPRNAVLYVDSQLWRLSISYIYIADG